jgi:hypothetical protein
MRLLALIILATSISFLVGAWMMIKGNPEVDFWTTLNDRRDEELAEKREQHPDKNTIIFTGGSSCAFGIIPEIIEDETGWNCMNYGGAAGAGSKFLIEQALRRCQPGDVLILALESHFLLEEGRGKPTQLGMALAVKEKQASLASGGSTFRDTVTPLEIVNYLRPGARYTATWAGKSIRGNLSYRYKESDIRPGGWLETDYRPGNLTPIGKRQPALLSAEGINLISSVVEIARVKGITIAYNLPWMLTDSQNLEHNRSIHASISDQIKQYMPVLDDPYRGAHNDELLFSDSEYHLNHQGSSDRTHAIMISIKHLIEETKKQ